MMKSNIKKILFGIIGLLLILFAWFVLDEFILWEIRAKNEYTKGKKELLGNWKEKRNPILSFKNYIDQIPFIQEFTIYENQDFNILLGNKLDDSTELIDLNIPELEDYFNTTHVPIDLNKYTFSVNGNKNNQNLKTLFSKTVLSAEDINELLKHCKQTNCKGFWRDGLDKTHITFKGHPFSGAFEYVSIGEQKLPEYLDINKKLESGVYWTYYESGLYCAKPFYLEN